MTIDSCLCREPAVESGAIITVTTQYTDDNGRWWERQNSRCLGLCSDLLLKLKKEIEITGMVSIISVASHAAAQSTADRTALGQPLRNRCEVIRGRTCC